MKLDDLILLVANKLNALNSQIATATVNGEVAEVVRLQSEIEITTVTLNQLRSLQ
jgi:hypothetical protein